MVYGLTIKPAIPVEERHKLVKKLEDMGYVVLGGGQFIDGSSCDISFSFMNEGEDSPNSSNFDEWNW